MDWIKLHRKSAQSEVFADADLWRLWCWLLMRAAFKKNHISIVAGGGRTTATINPGECITGRKAGAEALDWSPSTFERRLKKLAAMQMIEIDPQNHYSIIKILNWQKYQVEQAVDQIEQGSNAGFDGIGEQGANRVRTGCEQGANTNKNEKKDKKDKNYSLSPVTHTKSVFVAPDVEEVKQFWKANSLKGDPEEYHDHYTANGWTQGKASKPIKDWQATARNWSRRAVQFEKNGFGKSRKANVGPGVCYSEHGSSENGRM